MVSADDVAAENSRLVPPVAVAGQGQRQAGERGGEREIDGGADGQADRQSVAVAVALMTSRSTKSMMSPAAMPPSAAPKLPSWASASVLWLVKPGLAANTMVWLAEMAPLSLRVSLNRVSVPGLARIGDDRAVDGVHAGEAVGGVDGAVVDESGDRNIRIAAGDLHRSKVEQFAGAVDGAVAACSDTRLPRPARHRPLCRQPPAMVMTPPNRLLMKPLSRSSPPPPAMP